MARERLPARERRRQILSAAIRVFARTGFHGSTTRAIATEAGVAEALLYRYFPGKHALFTAAVKLTSEHLVAGLREILAAHPDDPIRAITQLVAFTQEMLDTNEYLAKMVFVVSAELDDPVIREVYLPLQRQAIEVLVEAIDLWKRRGILVPEVPSHPTAWLILACFQVLALRQQCGLPRRLSERDTRTFVLTLLTTSGQPLTEAKPA